MGALKSVSVEGYQALRKVSLSLSPGVNVIVGESDSGKSSLVRALRDALYQARGSAFVSEGHKKAVVKVEFADGRRVEWHKGKNVNRYVLDGERIGKPGTSVPEPVQAATGFRPVEFGEGVVRRVNFACQGEPMFLVADPPGEAARIIGGVSGAAELAGAVKLADSRGRALASEIGAAKRAVESGEAGLEQYSGLDEERARLNDLRARYDAAEARAAELGLVDALVAGMRDAARRLKAARAAGETARADLSRLEAVPGLTARAAALRDAEGLAARVRGVRAAFDAARASMKAAGEDAKTLEPVPGLAERARAVEDAADLTQYVQAATLRVKGLEGSLEMHRRASAWLDPLPALKDRLKALAEAEKMAGDALGAAERATRAGCVLSSAVKLRAEAQEALRAFMDEQGVCPTCGADKDYWRL
jgi:DNA repair exonuclease SbcCD ATPase subunit